MSLYLVATPIGNLEDITLRALRVLKEVDLIACEDTRHTRKLLDHYGIRKPLISYHEHNEMQRSRELSERLSWGENIALVTDAGTPGISDPAYRLVQQAVDDGITVIPIPGPVALIAGLSASGLPTDSFHFAGFLPHKRSARRVLLESLKFERATLVFYEAPHRILVTLEEMREILGDRQAALARELTKIHEQFLRGRLSDLIEYFEGHQPRGEMTLVIAGGGDDNLSDAFEGSIKDQIAQLMERQGLERRDAIKEAARARGITRREAYRLLLEEKDQDGQEENND